MTTRAKGRGETSPADDEFLQQLSRGGELLAAGRVHEAQPFLERAHQLQPRMEKAQNLLGLCYFKLGLYDRAAELYEMLVRDNPVDPTLRVNLGLVYLKTSALQRAAREFETATDLAPEHQKAQNYLGLTLAQMGEYGRAREHFLLAGSDVMAEKMSRAIAGESYAKPAAAPTPPPRSAPVEPRVAEPPPPAAEPEEEEEIRFAEDEGPSALSDASASEATEAAAEGGVAREAPPEPAFDETSETVAASVPLAPVPLTRLHLRKVPATSLVPTSPAPESSPVRDGGRSSLAELAGSVVLPGAEASRPFGAGPGCYTVAVEGELLTRLDGLVALAGQLSFQPEMKRFRGRATDKSFGEGAARMVRARGQGVLYLEPAATRTFLAVDLGEDSAYFRDECVFAFEEPVMFENGRVPSDIAPDLDLVHLRGQGQVLLSLPGPLRAVAVRQEQPVMVPLTHLVGWQGNLTPRMVPVLKSPSGEPLRAAVELGGEGFALIALGVR
ncbi:MULTISPECIES: tetratricopeptide repeat protein [Myxococcus]|uniref:tetratricopeptide repeat protein n=1 Tax=Myxococcus TaxID=32 RepID=UPI001144D372|nr:MULTISPECIES: tetratricopeptide repeat protein [Myxococcus]NOK03580.1 tetratricopeptide repeat protein [Myxococcus xanthus]